MARRDDPELIDISQGIGPETAVWPGDTPYSDERVMQIGGGCPCNVTTIRMSVHCGTHADAPLHYRADGDAPAGFPLEAFVGPCLVVDSRGEECVTAEDLDGIDLSRHRRLLFRTRRPSAERVWRDDFAFMSLEAARILAAARVRLVGHDAASMDPMDSKTLDAHRTMNAAGIVWLENLVLDHVEPGEYELIAPPLKLLRADAAPVRALLRRLP
ncbi:MAG: cyclase family protein [Planctomycetota bacterium]